MFVKKLALLIILIMLCYPSKIHAGSNKEIRSASEYSYPPFCVVDENGAATGFSVELLTAVLKAVGKTVDFYVAPWHEVERDLIDGKIQVLPMVDRTPEREIIFDFTVPYLTLYGTVFIRKGDDRIKSLKDLKDKEVLVMRSANSDEYAMRNNISPFIVRVDSVEEAMILLSQGKHDAVLTQHLMGVSLLHQLDIKNVVPMMPILEDFQQNFCFAVKKGDLSILGKLTEGLSVVIADGTFHQLYHKWLISSPSSDFHLCLKSILRQFLYVGLSLLFFIFAIGFFFLKRQVRKKTDALWVANGEWQNTFDAVPDMIAILDDQGNVLKVNQAMFERVNATPENIIGTNCCDHISEENCNIVKGLHQKASEDGLCHGVEFYESALGGHVFVTVIPLKNLKNKISSFVHIVRDINEQKKIEDQLERKVEAKTLELRRKTEALFETKRKYRIVAEFNADWEYWILPDKTLAYVSPSCEKMTGYTAQEFIDHPELLDSIIYPVDRSAWCTHEEERKKNSALQKVRFRITCKDGQQRWIEHVCQAVYEGGEFLGYRASNRDVTENHDAAKESDVLRDQLAHITRLHTMGELATALAHEINQPLSAILSNAQAANRFLTAENPDMTEISEALGDIVADAKRGGEVIRRLRRMVKSESPCCELFNITSLVKEVLSLLASEIVFNHIEVITDIQRDIPNIYCDRVQIQQVLLNLIRNAIEAMSVVAREKRILHVLIKITVDNCLEVSIIDNGCGINNESVESLFDPFKTTKIDGLGVGLPISRRIIETHKGKLWGEVNREGGMDFTFTIPIEGDN